MRRAMLRFTGSGLAAAAAGVLFMACGDAQAGPTAASDRPEAAFAQVDGQKPKARQQHFVRVRSDGTLVDGTAISASRFSTGNYFVKFPPPIGTCAAAASSAAFQGFDAAVFRAVSQVSIGFGSGGVFDDETVVVRFFRPDDGADLDTSFSLVMLCP